MKSKFNNSKRGFTIVELVIVIAIIAILAAVLIPTFSSLVQSAQMASDTSLITNLNKELAILIRGGKATINNVTINLDNNGPVSGKIGDSREVVFSSRSIVVDKYSDYTDCNNIEVNTKYKVYNPDGTEYKAN